MAAGEGRWTQWAWGDTLGGKGERRIFALFRRRDLGKGLEDDGA